MEGIYASVEIDGFTPRFWTPFEEGADRIGQSYRILRRATKDDIDDECAPMWLIRFQDGTTTFAHEEEIAAVSLAVYRYSAGLTTKPNMLTVMIFPRYLVQQFYESGEEGMRKDVDFETWLNFYTPDSDIGIGLCSYAKTRGYVPREDDELLRPMFCEHYSCFKVRHPAGDSYELVVGLFKSQGVTMEIHEIGTQRVRGLARVKVARDADPSAYYILQMVSIHDELWSLISNPVPLSEALQRVPVPVYSPYLWPLREYPEQTMVPTCAIAQQVFIGTKNEDGFPVDLHLEVRVNPIENEVVCGVIANGRWHTNLLRVRAKKCQDNSLVWEVFVFDEAQRNWVVQRRDDWR